MLSLPPGSGPDGGEVRTRRLPDNVARTVRTGSSTARGARPCDGGYRAMYEVRPDTGRDETAGDVRVLPVFGPGQAGDRL